MEIQAAQTQEFNVDEAMANIESSGSAEGPAGGSPPPAQADPTEPQVLEYEYVTSSGKKVKEPLDMILKRASQWYHGAQRMEEVKAQEARYAELDKRIKELSRWEEYDKYAQENPTWAEHVNAQWERRAQLQQAGGEDPNSPLFSELQALKQELGQIKGFVGQYKQAEEDKALSSEIESVRGRYKDIDFDLADESGKSLEFRILEHAKQQGIKSFKTAFHDFYHDHLAPMVSAKAKEEALRQQQTQRKSGIIGTTKEPTKGLRPAQSTRGKTYDQLAKEALEELGIGG